jgi:hypothetical protein
MDLSHLDALGVSVSGDGEIYQYESTEYLMDAKTVQQSDQPRQYIREQKLI